jgi:hypothetical protein
VNFEETLVVDPNGTKVNCVMFASVVDVEKKVLGMVGVNDGVTVLLEMLVAGEEELVCVRQTAEEDGKQTQVKQISRLMMVLLSGRQLREAFTANTSLPKKHKFYILLGKKQPQRSTYLFTMQQNSKRYL